MALPPGISTVAEAVAYFTARDANRELRIAALEDAAAPAPTIANTLGTSTLPASQVSGFTAPANALDTRLVALGV